MEYYNANLPTPQADRENNATYNKDYKNTISY